MEKILQLYIEISVQQHYLVALAMSVHVYTLNALMCMFLIGNNDNSVVLRKQNVIVLTKKTY